MSAKIGTYLVHKILDHVFGNTAYTPPATVYIALFTTTPTDLALGTGGVEVTGGSYARAGVTNNTTNLASASGRAKTNATTVTFTTPTATWGTIAGFGVYDAAPAGTGNWLGGADLQTPKTINSGDPVTFAPGDLTFSSIT